MFDRQLERVLFYMLQCKQMYFQSRKLTNIFYFGARFIHSLPLSVFTIELVARLGNYLFSDCKVSGTIARKTGLHVHVFGLRAVCAINFSRDQSSDKLINFLDSQLDTRDSRLDPRDSILETIEYRVSRLEGLSTYFWVVLYVCHNFLCGNDMGSQVQHHMVSSYGKCMGLSAVLSP